MGTPAGVLRLAKAGVMSKSFRLANVVPRSVSGTAVGLPLDMVTQSPDTLVPEHPVLKLIGVPALFPTTL